MRDWSTIHGELKWRKLRSISPEAAAELVANARAPGLLDALLGPPPVLLDVREASQFRKARPAGAVNAPLYVPVVPSGLYDFYRAVSFAFLGLTPVVKDTAFVENVAAAVDGKKNTPLLLLCASGGSLETASERKARDPRIPAPINGEYGTCSRSLIAAHDLLVKGGFTNVTHVEGGYSSWVARKLPGESD